MIDQSKNVMIGLFVIAACTIVVFLLLFLHPTVGDEGRRLRVRFSDIDKVNIGTRVTYAGKPVGEVTEIYEVKDASEKRKAKDGRIYLYELVMQVDSSVNVFNSDEVSLRTSGLLGERSVAITPLPPEEGEQLFVVNDKVIYANEVGTVEETFKEFKEVADRFDTALDKINDFLDQMKEEDIIKTISDTAKNIRDITEALNKPADWSKLFADATETLSNIRSISENIDKGKGTLGRLFSTDELYLRFTSILNKGETVMDDINHYGLLFHLDKGWKRLRARRMNLLQRLCSPQEFRNYFNDEIDQITTSLSRVGMVLDKTECSPMWECLIDDCEFSKVFAELLRRVEGMEEALKMYNEQLVETEVRKTELTVDRCCP